MSYAKILNIIGLLFSLAGIILLYWAVIHGTPMLYGTNMTPHDMIEIALNHDPASKLGIASVVVGTFAQIVATFSGR